MHANKTKMQSLSLFIHNDLLPIILPNQLAAALAPTYQISKIKIKKQLTRQINVTTLYIPMKGQRMIVITRIKNTQSQ